MKTALICVLIAYFIPYICTVLAKAGGKGMNNHAPRLYLEKLSGWRQRANWAQINNFENFAPFAFAVLAGIALHTDVVMLDKLAIGFVTFRVLHLVCYLMDAASLRSLMWFGAQICVVWLYIMSINMAG